jgi:hypothetical protein
MARLYPLILGRASIISPTERINRLKAILAKLRDPDDAICDSAEAAYQRVHNRYYVGDPDDNWTDGVYDYDSPGIVYRCNRKDEARAWIEQQAWRAALAAALKEMELGA